MNNRIAQIFPEITGRVEEKRDRQFWLWLLFTSAILVLTGYIIEQLHLQPFERIADLLRFLIPAYIITALVPLRFRAAVFAGTLVVSIFVIFSWVGGLLLLAMLISCFIILQLPVPVYLRAILLIGLLSGMAVLRAAIIQMPRVQMVIPYVAALIMFRSIIWLHEARFQPMKENMWLRISYFFCLPNLAFLFFPIVDYRAHVQFYYNAPSVQIWRKGLVFIFSGLLQFAVERVIRNNFNLPLDQVKDAFSFVQLVLVNYASLLQFSGALTTGVGFLCLFGFNLATPFGNFYFAESFFKYWQKVNIYWNEFLLKIAYYPTYFALRKKSGFATELSLLLVFTVTIFFHWYQKFWITGIMKVPMNDVVFWSVLGILIIANSFYNRYFPESQTEKIFFTKHLTTAFKTTSVFCIMAMLTWFWTAESFATCKYILQKSLLQTSALYQVCTLIMVLFVVNFSFSIVWGFVHNKTADIQIHVYPLLTGWLILLSAAIGVGYYPDNFWVATLSKEVKSSYEKQFDEVDYYGSILDNASGLWLTKLLENAPQKDLKLLSRTTDNLLRKELAPNAVLMLNGVIVHTNSYGMHDKEYSLKKPKDVYRIALLGGSYEMGNGVDDSCVYEFIVEKKLNQLGKKIELLNFSYGGQTTLQFTYLMDTKVPAFEPDAVIIFSHVKDLNRYATFLTRYIQSGIDLYYPYLQNVQKKSGVSQEMAELEIKNRLEPFTKDVILWTYDTIIGMCRKHKIRPIWMYAPTTTDTFWAASYNQQREWASRAGFECFSLHDAFDGYTYEQLRVSERNSHPNSFGHQLLAEKFLPIISIIDSTKKR